MNNIKRFGATVALTAASMGVGAHQAGAENATSTQPKIEVSTTIPDTQVGVQPGEAPVKIIDNSTTTFPTEGSTTSTTEVPNTVPQETTTTIQKIYAPGVTAYGTSTTVPINDEHLIGDGINTSTPEAPSTSIDPTNQETMPETGNNSTVPLTTVALGLTATGAAFQLGKRKTYN